MHAHTVGPHSPSLFNTRRPIILFPLSSGAAPPTPNLHAKMVRATSASAALAWAVASCGCMLLAPTPTSAAPVQQQQEPQQQAVLKPANCWDNSIWCSWYKHQGLCNLPHIESYCPATCEQHACRGISWGLAEPAKLGEDTEPTEYTWTPHPGMQSPGCPQARHGGCQSFHTLQEAQAECKSLNERVKNHKPKPWEALLPSSSEQGPPCRAVTYMGETGGYSLRAAGAADLRAVPKLSGRMAAVWGMHSFTEWVTYTFDEAAPQSASTNGGGSDRGSDKQSTGTNTNKQATDSDMDATGVSGNAAAAAAPQSSSAVSAEARGDTGAGSTSGARHADTKTAVGGGSTNPGSNDVVPSGTAAVAAVGSSKSQKQDQCKLTGSAAPSETAFVRCCADAAAVNTKAAGTATSAKTCAELGWADKRHMLGHGSDTVCGATPRSNGTAEGKCPSKQVPYHEAAGVCQGMGARLCTAEELRQDEARGTGCGLDLKRVWTSSTCG